ncbi:MAG: hypothetical protein KY469_02185 [Actinobacteria bacterium]|nr:hypothetical protein [Actinomycetota bacterium]
MCVPAQILYDTRDEVEALLIEEGRIADPGDLGPRIITAQLARGVVVVPSDIGDPLQQQLHERYGELVVIEPPMFVGEVSPELTHS